jgi:hypothetical protein
LAQAFSQPAGFGQAGAQGFGQAFSQTAGFGQAGAQGFGQAFSQTAGFGQAGAQGFGQAFSHTAGAGAQGFGQAFSHTAGAGAHALGAAFSQQAGAAQRFSGAQALSQPHFTLPHLRQAKRSFIPWNRSHRLRQVSQAGLQEAGAGAQAFTAGLQQAGAAHASHLPQPPQFRAPKRPKSSLLNPWLAKATLNRSAPNSILPFIEQTLLNNELG